MATEDEVRIGVFVCECGGKISSAVDLAMVEDAAAEMRGVMYVRRMHYGCSKIGLRDIRQAVEERDLDRIVIIGCTPGVYGRLFEAALEEAGYGHVALEMVNVREQCALVHADDEVGSTRKAVDLARMGVAKAALLEPAEKVEFEVVPVALVIGGGLAGMTAALTVAERGFAVKLVEKEPALGGQLAWLHTLYPSGDNATDFIGRRIRSVREHEGIEVLTGARVVNVSGSAGAYHVTVAHDGARTEFDVGAVIVSIGAQEAEPTQGFERDGARVMTQRELEWALRQGDATAKRVAVVVYEPNAESYSSVSAAAALKNSVVLKRRDPEATVSLLFNDVSSDLSSSALREASALGVQLYKYDGHRLPRLTSDSVEVFDQLRGQETNIPCDLVVLAMPLVPADDAAAISRMLAVPIDKHGFVLEPATRLRPGTHIPNGVFVCGSAHYPVNSNESVFQGYRAAARALRHLSEGVLSSVGPRARVIDSLCVGCGTCVGSCPFHAISMASAAGILSVASVDLSLCNGCGNCTVVCPAKAIVMEPYTDKEMIAQIDAALASPRDGETRVLAFMCEWSGYAAADLAGAEGRQYPSNVRIIRVGCSARFDPYHVVWAFLQGADGVLLGACDPSTCHYAGGNRWATERFERLRKMLDVAGFDARRLRLEWFRPDDAERFVQVVRDFAEEAEYLGSTGVRLESGYHRFLCETDMEGGRCRSA